MDVQHIVIEQHRMDIQCLHIDQVVMHGEHHQ